MKLNDVKLVGNLTKDPEVRYTPQGTPVATISLGVNEIIPGEEKKQVTSFIDCQVWGAAAENLSKLVKKGQEIFVDGSLRQERWEDKEQVKHNRVYVRANNWQFTQIKGKEIKARTEESVTR